MAKRRKHRGRPPLPMPEPIPYVSPEELAKIVLGSPPRENHEWRYIREHEAAKRERQTE